MDTLGATIRALRKEKGLSQAQLAASLKMSRATISSIENDSIAEVGIRKVEAILNLLGHTLVAVPKRRRPTLDEIKGNGFHG